MTQIQDFYSIVNQITKTIDLQALNAETQNLNKASRLFQTNPSSALQQINITIDNIIKLISKVQIGVWTGDHDLVVDGLDIKNVIGEKGRLFLEKVKSQIQASPATGPTLISSTIAELNKLRTKPVQLASLLQPFDLQPEIKFINTDESIIEIIFDGNVAISDFQEARDQMNDWFIIIEGYARFLNVRREDFEIIGMYKSSPSKFKIKTKLKNARFIVNIVTSLLLIEQIVLENRLMIDRLKGQNLVDDIDFQKEFINKAEMNIESKIKEGIEKIIEEKILEHQIGDNNGDVKTNFARSVENQYNFVINGGDINIHVIDGQLKEEVEALQKNKDELRQIKEAYENQKSLKSGQEESNE